MAVAASAAPAAAVAPAAAATVVLVAAVANGSAWVTNLPLWASPWLNVADASRATFNVPCLVLDRRMANTDPCHLL